MAATGFSDTDYLERNAAVWPGKPFFVNSWGWRTQGVGQMHAYTLGQGTLNNFLMQRVNNNNTLTVERDTGFTGATNGIEPPNEVWFSHQSLWLASNFRQVWLNAANSATDTTSVTPAAPNLTRIGISQEGTQSWQNTGALAETSVWDVDGFGATDLDNLAALVGDASGGNALNPLAINVQAGQPWTGRLFAYWDIRELIDIGGGVFIVPDLTGNGHDLTVVGTLSLFASHPPVDVAPAIISKEVVAPAEALKTISKVAGTRTIDPISPSNIVGVVFDFSTHRRLAPGSDNWPLTWADDDHQYSAWGDGGGFGGTNQTGRVSMGIARLEGDDPQTMVGVNVNGGVSPESGNSTWPNHSMGDVPGSGKSYAIISIGGVLWMWVSPGSAEGARRTTLWRSNDKGATWTETSVEIPGTEGPDDLASPTFVQMGQDYGDNADGFVYTAWIHVVDPPETEGFVVQAPGAIHLSRVPIADLETEASHEWLTGFSGGLPQWGAIGSSVPMYTLASGVGFAMSGITWVPAAQRFVMCVDWNPAGAGSSASAAGLKMLQAENPWGPWTEFYSTDSFGIGALEQDPGTFAYFLSPKWQDGLRFTMTCTGLAGVSSDLDSYNTVQGAFITRPQHKTQSVVDTGTNDSFQLSWDGQPVEGNLLIAKFHARGLADSDSINVPIGWQPAAGVINPINDGGHGLAMFFKIAGASEPLTVEFSMNSSVGGDDEAICGLAEYHYPDGWDGLIEGGEASSLTTDVTSQPVSVTDPGDFTVVATALRVTAMQPTNPGYTGGLTIVEDVSSAGGQPQHLFWAEGHEAGTTASWTTAYRAKSVMAAFSVGSTPQARVIGGTALEALAGVRRDDTVLTEAEGAAVTSRSLVTPAEALALLERADALALESLAELTRDRAATLEALTTIAPTRLMTLESLRAVVRDRAAATESLARLARIRTAVDEASAGVARAVVAPLEVESAVIAVTRSLAVPVEALAQLAAMRVVPTGKLSALIRDRVVPYEVAGQLLARSLSVPTESVAAVLQELGVPYEATSEIVILPPLTITAIPTARSLTIEPIAVAEALGIELVATAVALTIDFGEA